MFKPAPYDRKLFTTAYNLASGLRTLQSGVTSNWRPNGLLTFILGNLANDCAQALWPELKKYPHRLPYRKKDYPTTKSPEYHKLISRKYRLDRLVKRLKIWEARTDSFIEYLQKEAKRIKAEQKRKKKRRIRNRKLSVRPLTPMQLKVMGIYIQEQGNISRTAEVLGRDRKTIREHLNIIFEKVPNLQEAFSKPKIKPKMQKLPEDKRGQVAIGNPDNNYNAETDYYSVEDDD